MTSTYLYLIMHFILKLQKSLYPAFKTDVTPAILSRKFMEQLYRATKLQCATVHVASFSFVT